MNSILKGLVAVAAVSLPGTAFAQSSDVAYCKVLVDRYEHYLDSTLNRSREPQSLQSRVALEECRAGDARGIPGLEQAMRDARLDLPARTTPSAASRTGDTANCGAETWSTDQMTYVGVPCSSPTTYENPAGASQ